MIQDALAYAGRGIFVLPVWWMVDGNCACGDANCGRNAGKHPITTHGLGDASSDIDQVTRWWTQWPQANIGIALKRSGWIAFDVDKPENYKSLADLEQTMGDLPATAIQQSGSGNLHLVFRAPAFDIRGHIEGITLRGKNYIVAAPSQHASGGIYKWVNDDEPAELPEKWAEAIKKTYDPSKAPGQIEAIDEPEWLQLVPQDERVARMRAYLEEKEGEVMGRSSPGLTWNIARTCIRGFAVRDLNQVLQAFITIYNPKCAPEYAIDKLQSRIMSAGRSATEPAWGSCYPQPADSSLMPTTVALWARDVAAQHQPPVRYYSTGNPQLDGLMGGGLATTQVCGVIAPPSVGKSAFVGTLGCLISKRIPVLHISTELTRRELMVRYAALIKKFPWRDGMKGAHAEAIADATKELRVKMIGADQLDLVDPIGMIMREANMIITEFRVPPLIIIDYVQLLARGVDDGMRARIGALTMQIRKLAQTLDCPILAVFSTGRGFYGAGKLEALRALKDPTAYLGAAKESGDIEFDCATILFLDVDQSTEGSKKLARACVARCRVGDIGFAGFDAELATGQWSANPMACVEMLAEDKTSKKKQEALSDIDEKVLKVIEKSPEVAWRYLRDTVPDVGHDKADAAKARLFVAGRLVEEDVYDHNFRKNKTRFRIIPK